ncbi:MAG: cardiolipin synthase [Bacilli bacterium]|nr:cardiolipin synthase [Bacilli bacterium]
MKNVRKLFEFLTHRAFILAFSIFLEIVFIFVVAFRFNNSYFGVVYAISYVLAILVAVIIINGKTNPGYKIAWIMMILVFPLVGLFLYVLFSSSQLSKRERKKLEEIHVHQLKNIYPDEKTLEKLKKDNLNAYNQATYIAKYSNSPVCQETEYKYFKIGEEYYEKLLIELKKAKRYIFLEYFIIKEGVMWNSILEILKQKVKEGVEVRVMYDDYGCILSLPSNYNKILESYGIKACTFNKFEPLIKSKFNNRDHRKITVIDGYIAFTGGINLADEYINKVVRFGHWKDNGIMLKGKAVWNMTIMFMTLWDFVRNEKYSYKQYAPTLENINSDGFVAPYCDNPWDHEATGETIYLNMISKANKYIYITTPYLIIDNEMVTALCNAAKSGIDVRIITPGVPDKKMINEVTKSYYDQLIKSGVKIYEYSKGFIHAKTFIVDDLYATVGTVNLDYRSLYLHFENGVWLYNAKVIKDIKNDFEETIDISEQVCLEKTKFNLLKNLKRQILMVIAPLM